MSQNDILHITLMVLGIVVLLVAAFIGKTDKGGKRLMTHKTVGGIGVVIILLGVAGLVVTGAIEPALPHFYIALLALVFVILTPFAGLRAVKALPANKAALRNSHRFDAAVVVVLAALAVIFGFIGI